MKKAIAKKTTSFSGYLQKRMKDPEFKRAYDALELEDRIIRAIIQKRIDERLTQKQLAQKLGTTQSALARFESGKVSPRLEFVQKIANALDLRVYIA